MAWGVKPTCPITAIPASTIAFAAVILEGDPPSNLIASIPPSFKTLTEVSTACASLKHPSHLARRIFLVHGVLSTNTAHK